MRIVGLSRSAVLLRANGVSCRVFIFFCVMMWRQPRSTRTDTLFPYRTPFRSFPLYGGTSAIREQFGIPVSLLGMPWREAMYNRGDFEAFAAFGDVIRS